MQTFDTVGKVTRVSTDGTNAHVVPVWVLLLLRLLLLLGRWLVLLGALELTTGLSRLSAAAWHHPPRLYPSPQAKKQKKASKVKPSETKKSQAYAQKTKHRHTNREQRWNTQDTQTHKIRETREKGRQRDTKTGEHTGINQSPTNTHSSAWDNIQKTKQANKRP